MEPCGRLWPNGEFSIGYCVAPGMDCEVTHSEMAKAIDAHLGLSVDSNSHTFKDEGESPRGAKGLTAHGKKVLRNSVQRMQRLYGKKRLSFVTLTLPAVTYEEGWYVSTCWAEIVRVFYQKLGRRLERCGLPTAYVGCTELQQIRADREGHPALHLHFVIVGRHSRYGKWCLSPSDFREMWRSVLGVYLQGERQWSSVENVQQVKKDASAYLSKYVSKGICMERPPRRDETGWSLPTSWYNVSLGLRQWVLLNIRTHPRLMEMMERVCMDGGMGSYCHYYFAGTIEGMPGPGPHYFVGKLKGDDMRDLIEVWRCEVLDTGPVF